MTLQFIGTDQSGSSLLSQNKNLQTIFSYSPYGSTGERKQACPGFNSERSDPLTLATHLGNGYRAYSPTLMRFTCPDSLSPFGKGGINAYVYCDADPINHTDPSGHGKFRKFTSRIARAFRSSKVVSEASETTAGANGATSAINAQSTISEAGAEESLLKKQISDRGFNGLADKFRGSDMLVKQNPRDSAYLFGHSIKEEENIKSKSLHLEFWKGNFNSAGEDFILTHGVKRNGKVALMTYSNGKEAVFADTAEEFIGNFNRMGVDLAENGNGLHICACYVVGSPIIQGIADALNVPVYTYGVTGRPFVMSNQEQYSILFAKPRQAELNPHFLDLNNIKRPAEQSVTFPSGWVRDGWS